MDSHEISYRKMVDELVFKLDKIKKQQDENDTYEPPLLSSVCLDEPPQLLSSVCLDDPPLLSSVCHDTTLSHYNNLPSLILDEDTGRFVPQSAPVELTYSSSSESESDYDITNYVAEMPRNTINEDYVCINPPYGSGYPERDEDKRCCKCFIM